MPGFAVYYRYPNSQRVTYSQFIKVSWQSRDFIKLLNTCAIYCFLCMLIDVKFYINDQIFPVLMISNVSVYCLQVHWKWSQRITRLLIQCLESTEYMEIRNALILLTKVSNVFPVTRKSGINLEKRVNLVILLHLWFFCSNWLILDFNFYSLF